MIMIHDQSTRIISSASLFDSLHIMHTRQEENGVKIHECGCPFPLSLSFICIFYLILIDKLLSRPQLLGWWCFSTDGTQLGGPKLYGGNGTCSVLRRGFGLSCLSGCSKHKNFFCFDNWSACKLLEVL